MVELAGEGLAVMSLEETLQEILFKTPYLWYRKNPYGVLLDFQWTDDGLCLDGDSSLQGSLVEIL